MNGLEGFKNLGVSENVIGALRKKGFLKPTEIQEKTIPILLSGKTDVVAQAQTGTGKTAAFGIPLVENLKEGAGHVQALVLVPTRELAIQVAQEINSLRGRKKLFIVAIYGGSSLEQQFRWLKTGVDIVVGTPGRVLDLIRRGRLDLGHVSYVVLDEADEMLNMGFIEDVEEILQSTNKEKRTLLFSATMPQRILGIAKKYMKGHEFIRINKQGLTVSLTNQVYFVLSSSEKFEALCKLIDSEKDFFGLVFCRTKADVAGVADKLVRRGYSAEAIHGDVSQYQRERILDRFRKKRTSVLVATDVAARGIDIIDLACVVNYNLPQNPEVYLHRIGRTGRAGKSGTAITFVTPQEIKRLYLIRDFLGASMTRGKLPKENGSLGLEKNRIKTYIENSVKLYKHAEYTALAKELLGGESRAEDVVAALLRYLLEDGQKVRRSSL
jgi:ATP-dependent RNA helicase DeaD